MGKKKKDTEFKDINSREESMNIRRYDWCQTHGNNHRYSLSLKKRFRDLQDGFQKKRKKSRLSNDIESLVLILFVSMTVLTLENHQRSVITKPKETSV